MKDYNEKFKDLVNEAINNGWRPIWVDLSEGNDIDLTKRDNPLRYFFFISPKEWEDME